MLNSPLLSVITPFIASSELTLNTLIVAYSNGVFVSESVTDPEIITSLFCEYKNPVVINTKNNSSSDSSYI